MLENSCKILKNYKCIWRLFDIRMLPKKNLTNRMLPIKSTIMRPLSTAEMVKARGHCEKKFVNQCIQLSVNGGYKT